MDVRSSRLSISTQGSSKMGSGFWMTDMVAPWSVFWIWVLIDSGQRVVLDALDRHRLQTEDDDGADGECRHGREQGCGITGCQRHGADEENDDRAGGSEGCERGSSGLTDVLDACRRGHGRCSFVGVGVRW